MIGPSEFAARHVPGNPLLLPNAWDPASARWLAARGYDAIGTTSLGVAIASGLRDGAGETAAATMRLAEELTAAGIGVTVDVEAGFSDDPDQVGAYARRLAGLGVLGVNLEDADVSGGLLDVELAAAKVAAVSAAAPDLFLNARTDAYWIGAGESDAEREAIAVARARRYVSAGASGVFVPGVLALPRIAGIAAAVGAPLNVLVQAGTTFDDLAAAGVARVSTGSLLFRAALGALDEVLGQVLGDGSGSGDLASRVAPPRTPTYAEVLRITGSGG
ncbi:isocitrate lyase/PEP mutase family protein [Agromyces salentinus]|uniref:Isocitrate lyase/phosphoenolpyruvate mutase family protein n=1 Tax=Agromyces salentinus TaxID=269421 RepID=A0ABN2MSB5_9MICO|nr:isocitrate lyase/phosphoenolpyruvate mutase family protein [Agromyces salentinus]